MKDNCILNETNDSAVDHYLYTIKTYRGCNNFVITPIVILRSAGRVHLRDRLGRRQHGGAHHLYAST